MVIQVDSILDAHIRSFFVVTSSSLSEIFSLQMSWKLDNNRPLSPPLTQPKKITETSCPGSCNNQKVQKKSSEDNIPENVPATTLHDYWDCWGRMDPHAGNLALRPSNLTKQRYPLSSFMRKTFTISVKKRKKAVATNCNSKNPWSILTL
jgi:hypothetical protein